MAKPILVLDFDGVIHSYVSGWQGATVIADPATPGMVKFLRAAVDAFDVQILSSRSKEPGGIDAMRHWLLREIEWHFDCSFAGSSYDFDDALALYNQIKFPTEKPAAFLTIDDRAITFTGEWPNIETLRSFQPWNKKPTTIEAVKLNDGLFQRIRKAWGSK